MLELFRLPFIMMSLVVRSSVANFVIAVTECNHFRTDVTTPVLDLYCGEELILMFGLLALENQLNHESTLGKLIFL